MTILRSKVYIPIDFINDYLGLRLGYKLEATKERFLKTNKQTKKLGLELIKYYTTLEIL